MSDNARRLLVIGLDAVEAPLLREMIGQGELPNLAAIAERGVSTPIRTDCMDTLPGAIWQDILTGRSSGVHGDYYPVRLHTGESEPREIDPTQHGETYLWDEAARRGLRSLVVDAPLTATYAGISDLVTMVCEWHVHDSNYGRSSHPPELIASLEATHGTRPTDRCDFLIDGTIAGYRDFIDHLETEASVKADMVIDLMAQRPWDLCVVGMSQGHCAGHQLWAFHDAARSGQDHRGLGDGVRRVYRALDDSMGRIIAAAGEVDVVVFTSHGMDNYVGGPQLIPAVLRAMEFGDPRKVPTWLRPLVPSRAIHRLFDRVPRMLRLTDLAGVFRPVVDDSVTAIALNNNRCGAIRLNVIGREPKGAVEPSAVDAVADRIATELQALRHPVSGEPIVLACHRPLDAYGSDHHPDVPDLMVAFRQDLGLLDCAVSPTLGEIRVPVWTRQAHRTGDHTDHSHLWADVDSLEPERLHGLNSLDLADLILELAPIPIPVSVDDDG
jgi:predicted AlkP superfamily phosphohydrolase/phosphomutase